MGNLVVGNFNYQANANEAYGFIYNTSTLSYQVVSILGSTTLYGVWQNGGPTSSSYTIVGGFTAGVTGQGFMFNYNSTTGTLSDQAYFNYNNNASFVTHLEGISGVPGGFSLAATSSAAQGAAYAFVPLNADGSFGTASWAGIANTVNGAATTGNTVIGATVMGFYQQDGGPVSFQATVPEPSSLTLAAIGMGLAWLIQRKRKGTGGA